MLSRFASSLRMIQRKSWRHGGSIISAPFVSKGDSIKESKNSSTKSNVIQDTTNATIPREAHFKNPIVATLWSARQQAKRRLEYGAIDSPTDVTMAAIAAREQIIANTTPQNEIARNQHSVLRGKTPEESHTEITYSFSTDELLKEAYQNPWGEMRFGKILEDLDALAGNIAFQHVFGTPLIVTAGVDRIRLRQRATTDRDAHLSGKVTWVGNSSMEIRMQCVDVLTGHEWLEAYFTFVTLDPNTHKPIAMPPLLPQTQEERVHFELGAMKAQAKKSSRKNKLQVGKPLTEHSLQVDLMAASLLEKAGPLIRMPSLADPHSILMHDTKMQNAMVAQPQMQNLHNRIFGGFLMRRAFELAFANAYLFGGQRPIFLEVDDVSFEAPVDVGDLLVFNSRVLYTLPEGGYLGEYYSHGTSNQPNNNGRHQPLVMMEVECWVTVPEQTSARVSNHFYFTFALPEGTKCRNVLPSNIDEARRIATRITADEEQAKLRS